MRAQIASNSLPCAKATRATLMKPEAFDAAQFAAFEHQLE